MKKLHVLSLLLALLLALPVADIASAQEQEGETIAGTIVGVDLEAGTVDILQEDGTVVTISLEAGDYDHPIVTLLAAYFGGDGIEDWTAALETLELSEGVVTDVVEVVDGEGNVSWEITLDDGTVIATDDAGLAGTLTNALYTLDVSLDVMSDGETLTLPDVGEQIEAYHDAGFGFGQLVKIYAIADESRATCEAEAEASGTEVDSDCAVTVEDLAEMVLNGMGMGYLFDQYGKPSLLGVGHVRRALGGAGGGPAGDDGSAAQTGDEGGGPTGDDGGAPTDDGGGGGGGQHGVCNARAHGGKAHAKGQDIGCP